MFLRWGPAGEWLRRPGRLHLFRLQLIYSCAVTWKALGACRKVKGVDFFPDSKAGRRASQPARKVCADCFVRAQCLDYALKYDMQGIWGGTTEADRKRIKARYIRVKKPLASNNGRV